MDSIDHFIGTNSRNARKLGSKTRLVFDGICHTWPANPLEVATHFNDVGDVKKLSAKYLYHFRKLNAFGLIRMKKIGNTYVAWPVEIEKLRVIHEITKGI